MSRLSFLSAAALLPALVGFAQADSGSYTTVSYEASAAPGELQMGVTYTIWIPDGVDQLRGIIVHQHGCGVGACKGGETAAYDLHWQALARKWDCALLGPSYHQAEDQNCRLWCNPNNGSGDRFLQSLEYFAKKTGHPELAEVPWCLWGHSGGGFWVSLMQTLHPKRTVAVWCRSGTAMTAWSNGEIEHPTINDAVDAVPVMCNTGVKERDHERFHSAWDGCMSMFQAYRARNAPIGFAPDPHTAHECGDSRYLAIPFFDACLAMRLPDPGSKAQALKPVDWSQAWLAEPLSHKAVPAAKYEGDPLKAVWLPNAAVAEAWAEYVQTGAVSDETPPPAPFNVHAQKKDATRIITWDANADFQSGLRQFIILRDGEEIGRVPKKPVGSFGRPLFQSMSYHDTPKAPLPVMRFVDEDSGAKAARYQVVSVNSVGLKSEPAPASSAP